MSKRVLILDSRLDPPPGCSDLRRYLNKRIVEVRKTSKGDLPVDPTQYSHIVLSGSRMSCLAKDKWVLTLMDFIKKSIERGVPLLGICFGHQLIARTLNGESSVRRSETPEFGWSEIFKANTQTKHSLLAELPQSFYSFQSHVEEVVSIPAGYVVLAANERCGIQAFSHQTKPVFGIQFHPERNVEEADQSILHRKKSDKMSKNWLINVQKGQLYFNEHTATTIFGRFLEL